MRSDLIKSGVDRTPHKALLKALGVTDSEMHNQKRRRRSF